MVLDLKCNGTFISPVNLGGVRFWKGNSLTSDLTSLSLISEHLLVLEVGPGRHEVMGDGEASLLSIDLFDLSVLLGILIKSELVLLFGTEGESIFRDVIDEGLLELKGNWLIAELIEAKVGSSFTDSLHF